MAVRAKTAAETATMRESTGAIVMKCQKSSRLSKTTVVGAVDVEQWRVDGDGDGNGDGDGDRDVDTCGVERQQSLR